MAQNREKDETLDLQVPTETPLSSLTCPENNFTTISGCGSTVPDPTRLDRREETRTRSDERMHSAVVVADDRKRTSMEVGSGEPAKRAVNRCSGCRKRVGLTGFRCRCGDLFCSEHRYSDRHECSYDYKTVGREAIARENPVVRAAKILKV